MKSSNLLNKMLAIHLEMQALDVKQIYSYYNPEEPCTKKEILRVEDCLGIKLDKQYADFLQYANGWKHFYRSVSLFGTKELVTSDAMNEAKELLAIECSSDKNLEYAEQELLPIALAEFDSDLFVMTPTIEGENSKVIWFAGGEIERFDSFEKFFVTIMGYVEDELEQDFKGNKAP